MNQNEYSRQALLLADRQTDEESLDFYGYMKRKYDSLSPEVKKSVILSLGDMLWAISVVANTLGYTLEEVMDMNIEKLRNT